MTFQDTFNLADGSLSRKRISICRQCPLFNAHNKCLLLDKNMVVRTLFAEEQCPRGKWNDIKQ